MTREEIIKDFAFAEADAQAAFCLEDKELFQSAMKRIDEMFITLLATANGLAIRYADYKRTPPTTEAIFASEYEDARKVHERFLANLDAQKAKAAD